MMRMIVCIALTMVLARLAAAESGESVAPADLTGLSIEQLLSVEVYTASKFPQKTIEAPAAVAIITAEDIKTYGPHAGRSVEQRALHERLQ